MAPHQQSSTSVMKGKKMLNAYLIENQYGWNYGAPAPHKTGAGRETRKLTSA